MTDTLRAIASTWDRDVSPSPLAPGDDPGDDDRGELAHGAADLDLSAWLTD